MMVKKKILVKLILLLRELISIMRFIYFLLFFILVSFKAFSQFEVQIGTQIWMTKNLDVERFRNGDKIPEAKTEKNGKVLMLVKNRLGVIMIMIQQMERNMGDCTIGMLLLTQEA